MSSVGSLKRQRGMVKRSLTRLQNFLSNTENFEVEDLRLRKDKLEKFSEDFSKIQLEIEELAGENEEEEQANEQERLSFDTAYYNCLTIIIGAIRALKPIQSSSDVGEPDKVESNSQVNPLQKIKIKSFSGNTIDWCSFRDTFKSLVHDNSSIPTIQKFHYLKYSLEGDAAEALATLTIAVENYTVAWDLLNQRYNKPRQIIQTHIKCLLELPNCSQESPIALRSLLEKAQLHVHSLQAQKVDINNWDPFLVYIISSKLDKSTRRIWEKSLANDDLPTFSEMITFLQKEARGDELECPQTVRQKNQPIKIVRNINHTNSRERQGRAFVASKTSCAVCKEEHYIQDCNQFLGFTIQERFEAVKTASLCFNCFRPNHLTSKCFSRGCKICNKKHNTLLHFPKETHTGEEASQNQTEMVNTELVTKNSLTITSDSEVLLGTALIKIVDKQEKEHMCRVLLDSGSQAHFITENLANRLNLEKTQGEQRFSGLGQGTTSSQFTVTTKIISNDGKFSSEITFTVLPSITGCLPTRQINRTSFRIPKNIYLADPEFHKPQNVDALIGNALLYQLLCIGQFKLVDTQLILQKTLFGWLVTGSIEIPNKGPHNQLKQKCYTVTSLDEQVSKFWELEEYSNNKHYSKEEVEFQKHFEETTTRTDNGRFLVRLPFNDRKDQLGNSYQLASQRLWSLERKLSHKPEIRAKYNECIDDWLIQGHLSNITESNIREEGLYLPHHAVVKQSSLTTQLRVVFDGSAKTSTGISLNDVLRSGPNIQDSLFSIIANFRLYTFVFSTDIEKMYRQIFVDPKDRIYQKILWRFKATDPIQVFMINVVTFGITSSSAQATACLAKLAQSKSDEFPLASKTILKRCYIDNILSGTNDFNETISLRNDLIRLLGEAGFNLRQWASNNNDLINDLKASSNSQNICLDNEKDIKVLGIQWNSNLDQINYVVKPLEEYNRITKRNILSQIAQLFDPLGLLGPVIVQAKLIMQDLWKLNLDWDESVPQEIHSSWIIYKNELSILNKFCVPRKILIDNYKEVQLHGIADASSRAYGACIYLRSIDSSNKIVVKLLCSKSRVAPLKTVSVPRLELCAAVLLARFFQSTKTSLDMQFTKVNFWSDSSIVLNWINSSPHILKTFVANRISEIHQKTEVRSWSHISTVDNPADFISRGQLPSIFINNSHWLNGPTWLSLHENDWKKSCIDLTDVDTTEIRQKCVLLSTINPECIFERFSTLNSLINFTAIVLRLIKNHKKKSRVKGNFTVEELNASRLRILTLLQEKNFKEEIHDLKQNNKVNKRSTTLNLNPFLDDDGLLRVGGRLKNSHLRFNQKYPILLPKSNHVTKLIIRHEHERNRHTGLQATLNNIRQNYWPIDGKNMTRHILRKCVRCFKNNPIQPKYLMCNLPEHRITPARPFSNVGIDYCGPFYLKEKKLRNTKKIKAYVAVFICFATKAIHLELVTDLTTEACIAAIKRLFARRGQAKNIFSDNATYFVGAKNEFKEITAFLLSDDYKTNLKKYLTEVGINWHFSPPGSPHFGGLWEAGVKSFKYHLHRSVGETLFTYEQFYTFIVEIESILNSRPLTPLSSDPNDLIPLTPAHFLIGDTLLHPPEEDLTNIQTNTLSTWKHIQNIKQHFWSRWKNEYLNEMQKRTKWQQGNDNKLQIGTMVLLRDENLPTNRWKLGRIIEIFPGNDNVIRVATVKTVDGIYKRAVKHLYPLPIDITE